MGRQWACNNLLVGPDVGSPPDPWAQSTPKGDVMRRSILLVMPLVALLGLTLAGTADAAPYRRHSTYTVTRTVGPYNGAAKLGEPGSVPDGEAPRVNCKADDVALRGYATINRRTSHGFSRRVLTIGKHGVAFNEESGYWMFYAFVNPTGRQGWNSVTLHVTCRRH
jgi:hypothetical protein